jgi:serine/threonine protein kinase/tetratricopeptide (TPR) repeat protein
MSDDGKRLPDSDAPTLPGLPASSTPNRTSVSAATQTPPPSSNAFDAPTLLEAGSVPPRSPSRGLDDIGSVIVFQPGTMLGGRYQLLRVLGQGGMGAVYQARDQELDRVIALKVIRPELAGNPSILQRFKQELILSRHVTHKNVVRIYDMGEADGTKFITMEYVHGEDLRGVLTRDGKLESRPAVEIVQQICRALDAAHAEGVIHRDLKPQNVMVDRQGRVVVMDFGLARSLEAPGMTQTGALVGTLEYMSPEQAMGAELDQRSDLFALGLIFFELLTGKVPYKADTAIASLMKRTQERAIPASELDSGVPKSLSVIVAKCLERDPNQRFQSAQDVLRQLDVWMGNPGISASVLSRMAPSAPSRSSVQISLNLPSRRGWVWLTAICAIVVIFFAVPATRHLVFRPNSQVASESSHQEVEGIPDLSKGKFLAVLPLKVIGDEKSLRYVSDGLVDALSAKIFQLQEVHVASSAAVEKAASNGEPVTKIARALGVNLILQGMVQGSADKLRITLDLEDIASGHRMWSQEFSGVPQDLLTLEDQIYGSLVAALDVNPTNEEVSRGGVHPTENTTAYDLYLKGRDALRGNQGSRDIAAAVSLLQSALHEDPNFALAYTGLADANLHLYADSKDPLYAEKALAAANKAETLDPSLPEVHLVLGSVYTNTGRSAEAISELKRALALAPNSDDAYRRLGKVYLTSGRKQEALSAYQSAVAANPYYWSNHNTLGGAYFQFGENDKALKEYQRVSELAADNPIGYRNIGAVYFRLGRWNEAIPGFQKALELQPDAATYSNLGTTYFFLKRNDDAIKMFEKAVQLTPKDEVTMGNLADAYRAAGRSKEANAIYDKAIQLAFQQLQVNPKLASVTGDLALYYAKKGAAGPSLQYIRQARALDASDLQLLYNQAQIYALAGKQKEAMATLRDAFQQGYSTEEALNDPELITLKGLPEFTKLVSEYSKKN